MKKLSPQSLWSQEYFSKRFSWSTTSKALVTTSDALSFLLLLVRHLLLVAWHLLLVARHLFRLSSKSTFVTLITKRHGSRPPWWRPCL